MKKPDRIIIDLEPDIKNKMQKLRGETGETYKSMVCRALKFILAED